MSDIVEARVITDTDRLEFITNSVEYSWSVRSNDAMTQWVVWDASCGLCLAGKGSTMREAIDNAMNYKQGEWNES